MASRQVGNVIKPKFIVSVAEGVISMKTQSTFKSTEIKFKLDEEFEERTADDRVTKVGSAGCIDPPLCFKRVCSCIMVTLLPADHRLVYQRKVGAETNVGRQEHDPGASTGEWQTHNGEHHRLSDVFGFYFTIPVF